VTNFAIDPSPISAVDVARADGDPQWVEIVPTGDGDEVWWDEPRPHEGGRRCVVRRGADGVIHDVLPPGWNARNRVIEYGGRSWRPLPGGRLVFTHWADQRLYLYDPAGESGPVPLTGEPGPDDAEPPRYAALVVHGDEVMCVRERGGRRAGRWDISRDIVAVPLDGSAPRVLVRAQHFLMNPRISPDGRRIAWIGWDHPDMPWDATELCVAELPAAGGGPAAPGTVVAGGPGVSVIQAEWRDATSLYAIADPTGWWNVHLVTFDVAADGTLDPAEPRDLAPLPMEFGAATWKLGLAWLAVAGERLVTTYGPPDRRRLGVLDPATGEITEIGGDYTHWSATLSSDGETVVGVAASPFAPGGVVRVDLTTGRHEVLSRREELPERDALPEPEAVTIDGVHAHVYPPRGADGPAPYVVFVHGGPTGAAAMVLDLEIAYFTSRGIGVAEVNYGGSTGYGRAYRERLRHQWGVVDVRDCETVARGLVAAGRADPERIAIRGGSAGGWTSVAAIVHSEVFRGAVARYAITDPEGWARETHDFESRYLDGLIGPLPETRRRYAERSPLLHADRAAGPVLLLHGMEDAIVDPDQAKRFADALAAHGKRWAFHLFPGEQHGWRQEATIVAALELELAFYGLLFDFPTPEVPPLVLT
jgi:dipeptidyl aminopeptidase/acylaminoacyl peptidase